MYRIYRNQTKEDHPQLPSRRKDLSEGERLLVKILCTVVAALMSSWWGCALWEWCFMNLIFQVFWKTQNWSAAQYHILAMLIISCSQTDHRLSGLPNKTVQMHPRGSQGLCVLMLFFRIPKHRWKQKKCSVVVPLTFLKWWLGRERKRWQWNKRKP